MDNYNKELENNLLEMVRQKELADKRLLTMEIVTGITCLIPLAAAAIFAEFFIKDESLAGIIVLISLIPLLVATPFMIKIEQTAGYYVCAKCGHKYVPEYKSVFMAMHYGRTRFMRCPECKKLSWQKKVVKKD